VRSEDLVLDVATGTGIIAEIFFRKAKAVVGLDFTQEMFKQALLRLNFMVNAQAEKLPFSDNAFDLVTCRQGLQFMDALKAVSQMHRVCKPGARSFWCSWWLWEMRIKNTRLRSRWPGSR